MRRPNQFLKKKYISSLVIAAFMILSILTAYNIRTGREDTENTEAEETIGNSDDVISSGRVSVEDGDNDTADSENTNDERIENGSEDEGTTKNTKDEDDAGSTAANDDSDDGEENDVTYGMTTGETEKKRFGGKLKQF
ncbi:MAG: hypothetical protein LUF92_07300 [Clostridiales bacterium]|nr:hypothetical protein [Clostridiales bacterium]